MNLICKQLDLEVTSECNLKCLNCPTLSGTNPARHMDFDFYKSIIDRIDFPVTVIPWLNGEPLLHPRYYEMIKMLTDRKLRAYITTNGTIWNDKLFELITENTSVYQIIFSLDGLPSTRSIELARPGSNRPQILGNILKFLALKVKKKAKISTALKICRRGQDWEEIENYINLWLGVAGVDFVCVGDSLVDDDNDVGFRNYPCQYSQNNFMVIKSDGRVPLCAYNNEMQKMENCVGVLDKKTPLIEFYNNDKYKEFRKNQLNKKFHPTCAKCGFAYTGYGFRGEVKFRGKGFAKKKIYFQKDYYNMFFSYRKNWKPDNYYMRGDQK